ncbi:MAG: hypothetical protein J3R72DRAFT_438132, partial [Linnemannia gamsii]
KLITNAPIRREWRVYSFIGVAGWLVFSLSSSLPSASSLPLLLLLLLLLLLWACRALVSFYLTRSSLKIHSFSCSFSSREK